MRRWRPALIRLAVAGCTAAALAAGTAAAAEMVVRGEVIDVVPLAGAGVAADCRLPRPARAAPLVELLAWDLRAACPAAPDAFRVYYRWDGRTYSQVMTEPPGDTVPLRVRVQ